MIPFLLSLALAAPTQPAPAVHELPVVFRHDRVFVESRAPDGSPLEFYTDSGGGWNAIAASVAKRLALPVIEHVHGDEGEDVPLVAFPSSVESSGVPPALPEAWLHGHLVVAPDDQLDTQGLFGNRWFAGRIWQFDYAAHTLRLLDRHVPDAAEHRAELGFRTKADGSRAMNFPRVAITVDGETFDMLLDTGANAPLAADAAAKLGLPEGTRVATSFIIRSRFEAWQRKHPDWPVVEKGEAWSGTTWPMIEVPQVEIAGIASGPVWFTERSDPDFRQGMSQMTDRPVDGSIGGSALKYYRMVLDYPGAVAWFESAGTRGP